MHFLAFVVFWGYLIRSDVKAECSLMGRPSKTFNNSKTCCLDEGDQNCINCVRVVEGTLPMIFTVPHGGNFRPRSVLSRTAGCYNASSDSCIYLHNCPPGTAYNEAECRAVTASDYRSDEIAALMHDHIYIRTNKCPTMIMSILHRSKLDPNRNDTLKNFEATFNQTVPLQIYKEYHRNLREQITKLNGQNALALAIHGYSNDEVNWTIFGYKLSRTALNTKTSSQLDEITTSSISRLVDRMSERNESFSSLIYGDHSLGAYLERETVMNTSLDVVPSPTFKKPDDKKYFAAESIPITNDYTELIDSILVEIHGDYRNRYTDKALREPLQNEYARALGDAIINFFREFYDACILNPCLNSGTCNKEGPRDYSCLCQPGYTGKDCDAVICDSVEVEHATRDEDKASYTLSEMATYTCEAGYQISGENAAITCTGPNEWSGATPTCIEIPDPCDPSPCKNGQCSRKDGNADYECRCKHRWVGRNCDDYIEPTTCLRKEIPRLTLSKNLYCIFRGYFKSGNKCCKYVNACQHDPAPCSFNGKCACFNLFRDYTCLLPSGAHCPVIAALVPVVIVAGIFVHALAALAGYPYALFLLQYSALIAAACTGFIDCQIAKLGPGSIVVHFAVTQDDFSDPAARIAQSLESANITGVEVKEPITVTNYCDKGEYRNEASGNCTKCPAGYISNNIFGTPCVICQSGYYQDEVGQSQCKPCDSGYFSVNMGSLSCVACPQGQYSAAGASNCTECDPGSVSQEGQANCTSCEPGAYPNDERSQCVNCSAGTYSKTGLECFQCGTGSVSEEGQGNCTSCEPGTSPNDERSQCVSCSAGTYSDTGLECRQCGPGSVADEGESNCTACEPGTEPNNERSQCVSCSPGTYSNTGLKCLQCGTGSVSEEGQANCTSCEPGTSPNDERSQCVSCSAGTYSDTGLECRQCGLGSVADEGEANCSPCVPGTEPNEEQSLCVDCSAGTYSVTGSECLQCEPGSYSFERSVSCLLCDDGSIPNSAQSKCEKCEPGVFALSGYESCKHCEDGTYSSTEGQSECIPCNAGYIPNPENTDCNTCPAGNWSYSGDHVCRPCEGGSISSAGQPTCTDCNAGTAPNDEKSKCLDCPLGFNSSSGDKECSQCPPDMWSSKGSALCSWCEDDEMPLEDQSGCVPNIAYKRKTKQKSRRRRNKSSAGNSGKAVDGQFYNSCSRTKRTRKPWWRVKLDGWYTIKYVAIQTSKDPTVEKLHDIKIYINGKKNLCGEYPGPAETGERIYITCDSPIVGKNVRVEMTTPRRKRERLILCELFVIGDPASNPENGNSTT